MPPKSRVQMRQAAATYFWVRSRTIWRARIVCAARSMRTRCGNYLGKKMGIFPNIFDEYLTCA